MRHSPVLPSGTAACVPRTENPTGVTVELAPSGMLTRSSGCARLQHEEGLVEVHRQEDSRIRRRAVEEGRHRRRVVTAGGEGEHGREGQEGSMTSVHSGHDP